MRRSVPSPPRHRPSPPESWHQPVLQELDGVARLPHLHRLVLRVRHQVPLGAVAVRAPPRAAAAGLVAVPEELAAVVVQPAAGHVVARAVRAGGHAVGTRAAPARAAPSRRRDRTGSAVAPNVGAGCCGLTSEPGSARRPRSLGHAVVERDVRIDDCDQGADGRRLGAGERRVDRRERLGVGAGEVDGDPLRGLLDRARGSSAARCRGRRPRGSPVALRDAVGDPLEPRQEAAARVGEGESTAVSKPSSP